MSHPKETEIKATLVAARMRRQQLALEMKDAEMNERSRMLASERRYRELLTGKAREGCCGAESELDRMRARSVAQTREFLKRQREAALKRAGSQQEALNYGLGQWRKAYEVLRERASGSQAPPFLNFVVLDTPVFILPSQGIDFSATTAPWNNVARVRGEWNTPYPANGGDYVSFVFVWKNPSETAAVINAESYLALNGFFDAYAEPGANPDTWGANLTAIGLAGYLGVLEYWNNPPTFPDWQQGQYVNVADLRADGGGIFGLGNFQSTGVDGAYDVVYQKLVVPPAGVVVFEVNFSIGHWTNGGYMELDFASDDFQVQCPAVVLAILN